VARTNKPSGRSATTEPSPRPRARPARARSRGRATGGQSTPGDAPEDRVAHSGAARPPRGDRSKRLLDLVMLLLRTRSPVTFRDIREQFSSYKTANVEAGLRAFERDKADLLELGVPIRYVTPEEDDALDEGGYVIELHRYRMPEVHLTTDEISALVLAASVARAVPGDSYGGVVDLALRKLAFDLPELPDTPTEFPLSARALGQAEPVLVHFPEAPGQHQRELSDRFAQLEAATRNRKRAMLRYRSASEGVVQEREIDPYALAYRQGTWLVIGYCHLRQDVRSFRLDRIVEMQIAPKPKSPDFERPAEFDVRTYASRSPWTFRTAPAEDVELEFRREVASAANEDFGPDAERADVGDGAISVRFGCQNPEYAVSRVLAAKGGIRVRRGERLRRRIADELAAVRGMYA
jgi:proteasome accessory factor B